MQTVHVRVNDAATGEPTPVRIRFTDAAGKYYAPLGRLTEFATDFAVDVGGNLKLVNERHAYINGTCEIALPPGRITVEINKGPEYKPIHTEMTLAPGKMALRFEVTRWTNLRTDRWYSGDTRSHFLSPHGALLEAAAEDVSVVNLLVWECLVPGGELKQHPAVSNILAFSGQRPALEMPGHIVVVNTMNLHSILGRLCLLNCHRVIYPLTFGGPGGFDNWTLADWCDQCHRKNGLVVGDNFFGNPQAELLADSILGKIDALHLEAFDNPEADGKFQQESELNLWYSLLDCGFRIPLVAGSGKDCNLARLGHPRTYARLEAGKEFSYQNWMDAVRAGRTFVTSGPLLSFLVNGADPGAVLNLSSRDATVRVQVQARSLTPFDRMEVVANRRVVASAVPSGSPCAATIEADIAMPTSAWLVARCWGPWDVDRDAWYGTQSSPVYVNVEDRPLQPNQTVVASLLGQLDNMLEWVYREGRFETDAQRERLANIFRRAKNVLEQRRQRHGRAEPR